MMTRALRVVAESEAVVGRVLGPSRQYIQGELIYQHCGDQQECHYWPDADPMACGCGCDICRSGEYDYLPGTSAIQIAGEWPTPTELAVMTAYCHPDLRDIDHRRVCLVESESYQTEGVDAGEIIMVDPVVVAVL